MVAPKKTVGMVTTHAAAGTTLAGAIVTVLLWAVHEFTNVTVPGEVGSALATIIATAGALYGGYLVPPKPIIEPGTGKRRKEDEL